MITKLQLKNSQLMSQIEFPYDYSHLENTIKQLKVRNENISKENAILKSENINLISKNSEYTSPLKSSKIRQNEISLLTEANHTLNEQMQQLFNENNKLKSEIQEYRQTLTQLENSNQLLRDRLQEVNFTASGLKESTFKQSAETNNLEGKISLLHQENNKLV